MNAGRKVLGAVLAALLSLTVACDDKDARHAVNALPADAGTSVCPMSGGGSDGWAYTAKLTADGGLTLENLRFGPRLLARTVSVAYLRIKAATVLGRPRY